MRPSKVSFYRQLLCLTGYMLSTCPLISILRTQTDVKRRVPFLLLYLLENCFVWSEKSTCRFWWEHQTISWFFNNGNKSFYLCQGTTYMYSPSDDWWTFSHVGFWVLLHSLLFFLMHINHVPFIPLHLAQRTYFWHLTNPRHIVETGYIIPVLSGVWRVSYGGAVLY